MKLHIIIGASAAGVSAAKAIRSITSEDEILMISKDDAPHSRCMLHHFLSGQKDQKEIDFTRPDFFTDNKINTLWNTEAVSIDTVNSEVKLSREGNIKYDTLLIATGAKYFIPPIPNFSEAPNVFGFRDFCDAEKIKNEISVGKTCVVIGSGLVGLDAAYALLEKGVKCHIVEIAERICPLQLDDIAGEEYKELFEKQGATFHIAVGVKDSKTDENGRINTVILEDGSVISCDFVIVAAGVRPNLDLVDGSGITAERFIKVDEHMQTNISNIRAAGDVTGIAGIWSNAALQGEIAGMNMCGIKATLNDRFGFKNTMNFYGLQTLSIGKDEMSEGSELIKYQSSKGYSKYIITDGRLTYALVQGDISNCGILEELIKQKVVIEKTEKPIYALSFADFWKYDKDMGEYLWD